MDENERYFLRVDEWVLAGIESGLGTLEDLATKLPGVYPTCIRDSIQKLSLAGKISPDLGKSLLRPPEANLHISAFSETDRLPLPHPLDFEWRFSWEASEQILTVARRLAKKSDEILLLSTPSIFYYTIRNEDTSGIRYIGDRTIVTEFLCGTPNIEAGCDFFNTDPKDLANAGVVVIDPPWYEDFFLNFMWLAAASCKIGGHVILSFPPEGTRPGIYAEWLRFLKFTDRLGMALLAEEEGHLPYDSPFFEINALQADGIKISRNWRKGIMRVFKKVAEVRIPKSETKPSENWNEIQYGSLRLKLRQAIFTEDIDPRLSAVVPGEILPSVSRRDPRRKLADVWTSGNRIFKCRRPDVLECVITALQEKKSPVLEVEKKSQGLTSAERTAIEESAVQLYNITEKERIELLSVFYGSHDI